MQDPTVTLRHGLEGKIAFVSYAGIGACEVCVMQANGANRTRLATFPSEDTICFVAWSPDGRKIAFTSHRTGDYEIYVMSADGSDQKQLTYTRTTTYGAAWSPDGNFIAFTSVWPQTEEVYVMNANGSGKQRLTATAYVEDGHPKAWNAHPTWSPDGRQIAFASARSGNLEIHGMNADGSEPRQLTDSEGMKVLPRWSPDGKHIAFEANGHIYVIDSLGRNLRQLTTTTFLDANPTWSPDGQYIAYQAHVGADKDARPPTIGHAELFVVSLEGTQPIRLTTTDKGNQYPSWIR
jgi:Tol biopolymer transport system component